MPAGDLAVLTTLRYAKKSADDAAATWMAEDAIAPLPADGTLLTILLTPRGPLVADDTNYARINVYKRTAGGAQVLVASSTTQATGGTGSWVNGIPVAIAIVVTDVLQTDFLSVEIRKSGAGVIVPAFDLAVSPSVTFVDEKLDEWSEWMNARLQKNYAAPFQAPYPPILGKWLEALVTLECYIKRGFNPASEQDGELVKRADAAKTDVKEAADEKDGLFELPLRADQAATSALAKGPLGSAEASPYAWVDEQAAALECNGGARGAP